MKLSQLFGHTLRDVPADTDVLSHQLLLRAGFIRPLGAGIFSYLHLAKRSMKKIESILREEMERIGGQEISMPVVHPADVWKESGRWFQIGSEMARFKDRNEHEMVLAMTHEEVVADLVRREIHSYKDLPRLIYHIQTKFRDEPRPRGGLIRVREFTMKDSYSLDIDEDGLDKQYRAHFQAYFDIFHRCGLEVIAVKSDSGMMGGTQAHEFMFLSSIGEDALILCDNCGYTANRQVARFKKRILSSEEQKPIEKVFTPACKSIDDLAHFLNVPQASTAKAVFFIATIPDGEKLVEKFIFAVIRGDLELNETKLSNAIGAQDLRPATEEEISSIGAVPGFASPIGIRHPASEIGLDKAVLDMKIVIDDLIEENTNLVAGANQVDFHFLNTNYPRDYQADLVADIASAAEGYECPQCSFSLRVTSGVEVGNIFKLGTRYSDALGCTFLDRNGNLKPVTMGSYGIGVGRLLACIVEAHHDADGIIWPVTVAPYQVHLILLRGKGAPEAETIANKVYALLQENGVEVLFDDRDESPGVKFNDADLIGLPIRLTVSERSLAQNGVELKVRNQSIKTVVQSDSIVDRVLLILQGLLEGISAGVRPVEYN